MLDPTLLLNGTYVVSLIVVQPDGSDDVATANLSVDGNMKLGAFTLSFTDLSVPVAGIPLQVVRTYDSRNPAGGDFGAGWTLDIKNIQVEESGTMGLGWECGIETGISLSAYSGNGGIFISSGQSHFVDVVFPGGKVYSFEPHFLASGGQDIAPGGHSVGSLEGDFGVRFEPLFGTAPNCTLVPIDGSGRPVTSVSATGSPDEDVETDLEFGSEGGGYYDPQRFLMTDENGNQYIVNTTSGFEQMTTLAGAKLKVDNAGIHWTGAAQGSKDVLFTRDSQGRITQIQDPAGNLYHYTYDVNEIGRASCRERG